MREFWKNREKGAIIVMFALFIPLMMICVGLAIDLGNLYAHKTRLQNAADAAALAGARAYAQSSDADLRAKYEMEIEDTVDNPQNANTEAKRYVKMDAEEKNLKNAISFASRAKEDENKNIYYRVDLSEIVPLYFLRVIPGLTEQEVKASSIAAVVANVAYEKEGGKDLFIFRNKLKMVNSISNPDNFDMPGQILSTFEGNIAFTDGSGNNTENASSYDYRNNTAKLGNGQEKGEMQISTQTDKLTKFFKPKAKEEGLSVNEAIKKGDDQRTTDSPDNDYWGEEIFENFNMDELGLSVKSMFTESDYKNKEMLGGSITSSVLSDVGDKLAITSNNGDGNIAVNIESFIPGTDPLYIYFDESMYTMDVNIYASNGRPLVFVCPGKDVKLHFNIHNGSTFSGIIYTPNVADYDNCLINNLGNSTFEGTIISNCIDLQGGAGTYRYRDFGVAGAGSSGNGAKVAKIDSSSTIKLVNSLNLPKDFWKNE